MAKMKSFMQISGSIGSNLVVYMLNGVQVVRTKPIHQNQPNSDKQLAQRNKWRLLCNLLRGHAAYFNLSHAEAKTRGESVFASLMKVNMLNAVVGTYPNQQIDWSKLKLGQGNLNSIDNARCYMLNQRLTVCWNDNSGYGSSRCDDVLMPAIYNKRLNAWRLLTNEAQRADERWTIELPSDWVPSDIELWITLRRKDGSMSSDSIHLPIAVGEVDEVSDKPSITNNTASTSYNIAPTGNMFVTDPDAMVNSKGAQPSVHNLPSNRNGTNDHSSDGKSDG